MAAQQLNTVIVNQFDLPNPALEPKGYFRSKLFVAPHHPNPLIAAASPIFSLLERLCVSPILPPIQLVHENLTHELQAFQSFLSLYTYPHEYQSIATYLLTATIDELVGKSYLRVFGKCMEFKAFTPSSLNDTGPETRFFDIIHVIKEQPNQYLDLIELAYYCLVTGFEGHQHSRPDGRQNLENLIEELHGLICQYRADKTHRLFKEATPPAKKPHNYKPLIGFFLGALLLLTSAVFISHTLIDNHAKSVLFGKSVLATLDD